MEKTQHYLASANEADFMRQQIARFTSDQQQALEDLLGRFEAAGATDPLPWAFSEVAEGIPQLARFLVLKELFALASHPEDTLNLASDFTPEVAADFSTVAAQVGEQQLHKLLAAYAKGLLYQVVELLDEGNPAEEADNLSWALVQLGGTPASPEPIIGGLHESFLGFEDELKSGVLAVGCHSAF